MGSFLGYSVRCLLVSLRGRGGGRGSGAALLLLAVTLGGGGAFIGDAEAAEEQQYSPYADPEKTAISHVLSDPQNVAEFQEKFALSDEELETVLAAIREENEALSRVRGESQQMIESNEGQPKERVKEEIEASGYDEKVRKAVARTKATIRRVLPVDRRREFKTWVDDKWLQESQEFEEKPAGVSRTAAATGVWFKVFATQYNGYTNYEVALPHRYLKYAGGYRVYIYFNGYAAWAPVKEVGPWNTYDNWWSAPRYRTMWSNLRRGVPEAQAAYYSNYNGGRDERGRKVLNPAGVDLTPAAAARLGLRRYQNAWIWVYVPWVSP